MYLTFRPAGISDIAACMGMLPSNVICDQKLRDDLPRLWSSFLSENRTQIGIVEEETARGAEIVGFGVSVFVTDQFALDAVSYPPPVSAHLMRLAADGNAPILKLPQIQRANTGEGLNLYVPMIGWAKRLNGDLDTVQRVRAALLQAFFYMHAGYKIKSVFQEIYVQEEARRAVTIGVRVMTERHAKDDAPYTCLTGAYREEIAEGSVLWPLFLYSLPDIFHPRRAGGTAPRPGRQERRADRRVPACLHGLGSQALAQHHRAGHALGSRVHAEY